MMYANGQGVEKNPSTAYMWVRIAQSRLKPTNPKYSDITAAIDRLRRQLTEDEIADAERQAEEWLKEFARK